MAKKRWFDDWLVEKKQDELIVDFPHSVGYKRVVFVGENAKSEGVKWLVDLIDCLATELTSKKKL